CAAYFKDQAVIAAISVHDLSFIIMQYEVLRNPQKLISTNSLFRLTSLAVPIAQYTYSLEENIVTLNDFGRAGLPRINLTKSLILDYNLITEPTALDCLNHCDSLQDVV